MNNMWFNVIYLIAGALILGVAFFFMMKSVDKKLDTIKAKSKKRR